MVSPIAATYGPAMVGVFVNIFLFGVVVCQVWNYFGRYKKDPAWLKTYVGVMLLMDALNTAFAAGWIFNLTIMNFCNLPAFFVADWLLACDPAMGGIIAFYCQCFYAWRLRVLTKTRWLPAFVVFCAFAVMMGGLGLAIGFAISPSFAGISRFRGIVFTWLIPGLVCDITVCISMTYYLRSRRGGFSRTEDVLNKIIRLTVQNSLLTSLCALGDLLSYLTTPDGYHLMFSFWIAKLYTNSVMSSLNSRAALAVGSEWERDRSQNPDSEIPYKGNVHTTSFLNRTAGEVITLQAQSGRNIQAPAVFVDVETHTHSESENIDKKGQGHDWSE